MIEEIVTIVSQKLQRMVRLYGEMIGICKQADGPEGYLSAFEKECEQIQNAARAENYELLKEEWQESALTGCRLSERGSVTRIKRNR